MANIDKTVAKSLNNLNNRLNMLVDGQIVQMQFNYNKETMTLDIISDAACFVYNSENKTLNIIM